MSSASPEALGEGAPPVSAGTLFHYASPLLGVTFLYMTVTVMYMNFATDVLGVAPGVIGTLFFLSKIWDAVSDPVVGNWSDRTRSRLGRRRSWMLGSALPLFAAAVLLWVPPSGLTGTPLTVWVGVTLLLFYTAFTLFSVPQMALGAELSDDPSRRATIFGTRQVATALGMLFSFLIATPLLVDEVNARDSALWLAGGGGLLTAAWILFSTWRLPEERPDYRGRAKVGAFGAFRDVLRNPHARLLLFVYFIEVFGIGGTSAMTSYMLKYVTKAADQIGFVFFAYTVPGVLFIPFWVWLGKRYERRNVWMFAMGLQAIGYGLIMFQSEGRLDLMVISSLINGFSMGCGATLGQAIKADVIDYDEYMTGERKEGAYFATWNLASKLGTGLMLAFAGWALQLSGFVENAEQSEATQLTIRALMGGAPGICLVIGMLAFSRFKLTSAEHQRIRREIDAR